MIDFSLFGLSTRDKRVYDTILTRDSASIRSIADDTRINRGSVYESLKDLTSAGLVTHVAVGKSTRYKAESPEKLHEIINERRRELMEAHADVDAYITGLDLNRHEPGTFGFASFFDGDEGMAGILRDVLATCRIQEVKEYKVISSPRVSEYLYVNFRNYTRERIERGLRVKVLVQTKTLDSDAELSERKLLPGTIRDAGCYIILYGGKTATISIDAYNHTSGIIIDNEGVTATYERLFDDAWKGGETPTQGLIWTR